MSSLRQGGSRWSNGGWLSMKWVRWRSPGLVLEHNRSRIKGEFGWSKINQIQEGIRPMHHSHMRGRLLSICVKNKSHIRWTHHLQGPFKWVWVSNNVYWANKMWRRTYAISFQIDRVLRKPTRQILEVNSLPTLYTCMFLNKFIANTISD